MWLRQLGVVLETVICLTLMILKAKSSKLLEIFFSCVFGSQVTDCCFYSFSKFGKEVK
jgi:hypothetical protein